MTEGHTDEWTDILVANAALNYVAQPKKYEKLTEKLKVWSKVATESTLEFAPFGGIGIPSQDNVLHVTFLIKNQLNLLIRFDSISEYVPSYTTDRMGVA